MKQLLDDLVKVMTLERIEMDLFRGESRDVGSPQVFGGQVLGQALMAATATVEGRAVHSLHAYFLRRGDFNSHIVYEVDRARDGNHFSTRRVVAIQHGAQIFNMSASFQSEEQGLAHQIEFRPARPAGLTTARGAASGRNIWFRAVAPLPDGEALHRCLLAYVSDFNLLDTALMPHGLHFGARNLVIASIDHAMWFHRSVRVDDWLLYSTDSPSASGARGFSRGSIFARDGRLVASISQEGLMRMVTP
jgi:acyl-CoA thioesterase-2